MNVLNAQQTQQILQQSHTVLLDVREPAEFASTHIEQAKSAPLSKIDNYVLEDDKQHVVVHCAKGIRAKKAIDKLSKRYPQVTFHNFESGIDGWKNAGYALVKGEKSSFPLDRQVQLTIGTGVFAGSVLSALVSPLWLFFTGFFGAGLIFSGATGTCGLALVLARMPWNK